MKLLLQKPYPDCPEILRLIAWICGPECHSELQFVDDRQQVVFRKYV